MLRPDDRERRKENESMGKVATGLSMSLDGFIAGPNDGPSSPLGEGGEWLFGWYSGGDTEYRLPGTDMVFKVSPQSAELLREAHSKMGAFVTGRRTFDITNGWGGRPPLGVPTFVVTHTVPQEWVYEGSPFTFVTDGVESAVGQAKAVAGDKDVAVGAANIVQQCTRAGLLDEIHVDLVPILLGGGIRLFDHLGTGPIELERTEVVEAPGVTHLTFRIVK
jgi:dihydrofolate reductase